MLSSPAQVRFQIVTLVPSGAVIEKIRSLMYVWVMSRLYRSTSEMTPTPDTCNVEVMFWQLSQIVLGTSVLMKVRSAHGVDVSVGVTVRVRVGVRVGGVPVGVLVGVP